MKKLSHKEIFLWMQDRTMQGVLHEEVGSCDSLEDADNFYWHCIVGEENGRKFVHFFTSLCLMPFATGHLTKTGKPRISWKKG